MNTRFWMVTAMLALGRIFTWTQDHRPAESLKTPLAEIPSSVGNWRGYAERTLTPGVLKALATSQYLDRIYTNGPLSAELFVAYYPVQRAGETMHSPNACLPGAGWEFSERSVAQISPGGRVLTINRDQIQKDGTRMWLLYWYQSHENVIANEYASKFFLFREAMFRGRTSGSFVRITGPQSGGSLPELMQLAEAMVPAVSRCFSD